MKMKTHKSTAKRFKVSASGKVFHNHQGDNTHLKANKVSRQKNRQKGHGALGSNKESIKIIRLLNY